MTRQCLGCGTVLPESGRSPRCPRCRADQVRRLNRAKVQAFRQRRRDYSPTLNGPKGPHLPAQWEVEWLDSLRLNLADPVWNLCELIRHGRAPYHDSVLVHARIALERYDAQRGEFDAGARQAPQVEGLWNEWRAFFEQLREAVQ